MKLDSAEAIDKVKRSLLRRREIETKHLPYKPPVRLFPAPIIPKTPESKRIKKLLALKAKLVQAKKQGHKHIEIKPLPKTRTGKLQRLLDKSAEKTP